VRPSAGMTLTRTHDVPNRDGWILQLHQSWDPARLDRSRRPVLIVPGYGMNSFIFSYHPRGTSMVDALVARGLDVFRVDLRAQGAARFVGGDRRRRDRFQLEQLAFTDLGAAIDATLTHAHGRADGLDVIGASLGGTLMFAHAAKNPGAPIAAMVAIGSPVRWIDPNPLLRAVAVWPGLLRHLHFEHTRTLARVALPLISKLAPSALSIYLHPKITDVGKVGELVKTVEDPNRFVNAQIARWIDDRDLSLDVGAAHPMNLGQAIERLEAPLLCVVANGDGIVPQKTARWPVSVVASSVRASLEVGDETTVLAHADLFISDPAPRLVFGPLADWLEERAR
jgi:pimeloyl-ACP methyl ester carboxylesterase